ncbi:Hypothetical protein A7982_02209 [Minicystis rosea]|nr:Hypothetical protein A7982_02209 [Minicystis rosea]
MSLSTTTTVTCPHCQKPGPYVVHQSVNVTHDPEAKAKVVSGALCTFTCPSCGARSQVTHPVLYHDMTRGLMIYLVPGEDEDRNKVLDELGPPPSAAGVEPTTRAVTGLNALKDKINTFDAGIDDRVLEVTKFVLKLQNEQLRDCELYLESATGDDLTFAAVSGRGAQRIGVRRSGTYTWLADKLAACGVLSKPLGPWPIVGERYAVWAFEQLPESGA